MTKLLVLAIFVPQLALAITPAAPKPNVSIKENRLYLRKTNGGAEILRIINVFQARALHGSSIAVSPGAELSVTWHHDAESLSWHNSEYGRHKPGDQIHVQPRSGLTGVAVEPESAAIDRFLQVVGGDVYSTVNVRAPTRGAVVISLHDEKGGVSEITLNAPTR